MICKNLSGETDPIKSIDGAREKIFDFTYPVPTDADFKARFEKKFLMYYFLSEICCETVALWKFWLNEKLNRIMPYYVDKYNSIVDASKIFSDVDYKVVDDRVDTGESKGSSGATNKYSDTPQGGLSGIEQDKYLTRAEIDSGNTSASSTTTSDLTRTVSGKQGGSSYAKMALEYREALFNLDAEIIDDCADLFMSIY